jgi:hypothetical protein
MPFTLSHPAAVVPIHAITRGRLRLAALVLGAMSPDVQYFVNLDLSRRDAHSLPGLVLICLPVGWLALVLFDLWGRRGVQVLLPASWRLPALPTPPRPVLATTVALLLGATTHVVWDAFTHASGWAVQRLPALQAAVLPPVLGITWFRALQHGSTVVGLAILAGVCLRWMRAQPAEAWWPALGRCSAVGLILAIVGILNGLRFLHQGLGPFAVAGGVAVTAGLGVGLLLLGWLSPGARGPGDVS